MHWTVIRRYLFVGAEAPEGVACSWHPDCFLGKTDSCRTYFWVSSKRCEESMALWCSRKGKMVMKSCREQGTYQKAAQSKLNAGLTRQHCPECWDGVCRTSITPLDVACMTACSPIPLADLRKLRPACGGYLSQQRSSPHGLPS